MLRKIRILTNGLSADEAGVIVFAAEELRKYLSELTERDIMIIENSEGAYAPSDDGISLGVNLSDKLIPTKNATEEDSVLIDVTGDKGIITASNPRAVLIGVYRYLRELGFAFVRPGKSGEIFPDTLKAERIYVCEKADTKIRAVCIEGADFYENSVDFIDWLPKIGMNSLHLQNFIPAMFYKRWFEISPNYHNKPIKMEESDIKGLLNMLVREMNKRGLILQRVGHGWTTEVFGISSNTWLEADSDVPDDVRPHLALVNGKREYHNGLPIGTNLCYGSEKTRKLLVDFAVDYCKKNPAVGIVHFWLADAGNNFCECEKCINYTASDLYAMLLNDLDEALTANDIKTRICIVVYCDNIWPPVSVNIKNPDRFILLFGPISRTYSKSYDSTQIGEMAEYVRNNSKTPNDLPSLLAHIKGWQDKTGCETILYDYHYMWDHFRVFGYWDTALRINEDIKQFEALKFDAGFISCQEMRVFFPSSFGQHVMANTLWNTKTEFEPAADKALETEFGANCGLVRDFLKNVTYLMNPKATRREESMIGEDKAVGFDKARLLADEFKLTARDNAASHTNSVQSTSWKNIAVYSELLSLVCKCYAALSRQTYTSDLQETVKEFVFANEWELRYVFDTYEFLKVFLELVDYTLTGIDRCVIP